jgi:hypothetical protein
MNETEQKRIIWTIGHSTRTIKEFIDILKSFHIECLADIRSFPGSKRYPHFNKEALEVSLPENNIKYIQSIQVGALQHSGDTQIIWKPVLLRKLYRTLNVLGPKSGSLICVQRLYGGAVTGHLFLIT